tara:strand:+ start:106 stop:489 length:384 start_codon:yes stop_codon:yes gene_type:complete
MKRFSHIFVSALLLFSTVGISVNKHYCDEVLKNIAINITPEHCCGDEEMPSGCCHNESEQYSIDDELQLQRYNLNFEAVAVAKVIDYHQLLMGTYSDEFDNQNFSFAFKSPPSLEPDIYVKVQSFLI